MRLSILELNVFLKKSLTQLVGTATIIMVAGSCKIRGRVGMDTMKVEPQPISLVSTTTLLKREIHGVKGEQICAKKSCTLCTDEKSAGFSLLFHIPYSLEFNPRVKLSFRHYQCG